jgi:hypothetical protein
MAVFGLYYTLHLHQPLWLIGMFSISIPMLIAIGHFSLHHMGKVQDWLTVKFSTHYGKYTYDLMESQLKSLEGIHQELKKRVHKNS